MRHRRLEAVLASQGDTDITITNPAGKAAVNIELDMDATAFRRLTIKADVLVQEEDR